MKCEKKFNFHVLTAVLCIVRQMAEADAEENVYREAVAESPVAPPNGDINIDDLLPDGPQGNIQGQVLCEKKHENTMFFQLCYRCLQCNIL